jgi:hypothetical protein
LNPYDRSIETDWNFLKLSCTFNLDLEIWLDNDTGGAAGKIRNVFASGATCAGWSIVVTSTA